MYTIVMRQVLDMHRLESIAHNEGFDSAYDFVAAARHKTLEDTRLTDLRTARFTAVEARQLEDIASLLETTMSQLIRKYCLVGIRHDLPADAER